MWGNPDISRKEPEGTVEKQRCRIENFAKNLLLVNIGGYCVKSHKQQLRDLEIPAPFATPH